MMIVVTTNAVKNRSAILFMMLAMVPYFVNSGCSLSNWFSLDILHVRKNNAKIRIAQDNIVYRRQSTGTRVSSSTTRAVDCSTKYTLFGDVVQNENNNTSVLTRTVVPFAGNQRFRLITLYPRVGYSAQLVTLEAQSAFTRTIFSATNSI